MTVPPPLVLVLVLGLAHLPVDAQQPGDEDYEADGELLGYYEDIGGNGSDYDLEEEAFEEARAGVAPPPTVMPPGDAEIETFRAALEAHWDGNLPALLAYLNRLDPASGSNPEPPEAGRAGGWHPTPTYDRFGNVIESAEAKRNAWRRRVEQRLGVLAER